MVAVSIDTDPELDFGTPEELFEWPYSILNQGRAYDVSPDGARFLAVDHTPAGQAAIDRIPRINIVVNWFEELKRRVPVD